MRIGSANPSNPRNRSVGRATSATGWTYGLTDKQLTVSNIFSKHGVAGVPGLLPDLEARNAYPRRAGSEPRPQRMTGVAGRINTTCCDALLDDDGNGVPGHPFRMDMPVSVNGSEYAALIDF